MSKLNQAIHDIHFIDDASRQKSWLNCLHPLAKVIVTLWYIVLVMSFGKYNLSGLAAMCLYPAVTAVLGDISVKRAIKQLRPVLIFICIIGIANPVLDREAVAHIGNIAVTGGMISMLSLVLKAVFAVSASYLLMVTTSMEQICAALRMLHVPKILVTLVLLIYRYMILMLKEAERITQGYALRAPGQKGIHYKVWGTLAGQMLLRSMDRAELVYESMTLRGFTGEFYIKKTGTRRGSILYTGIWTLILLCLRLFPLFETVGGFIV